jgi:hypothetical protein
MVDNFEQQILFTELLPPIAQISKRRKRNEALLPAGLPEFKVIRNQRRRRSMSAYRHAGVIENYIIFHELIHLQVPGHDDVFKNYLNRYEDFARAEAFLEGFEIGCQFGGSGVMSAINN